MKAVFLSNFCKSIFQSTSGKIIFTVLTSNSWYKINYCKCHNDVIGTNWRSLQTHRKYSIKVFPIIWQWDNILEIRNLYSHAHILISCILLLNKEKVRKSFPFSSGSGVVCWKFHSIKWHLFSKMKCLNVLPIMQSSWPNILYCSVQEYGCVFSTGHFWEKQLRKYYWPMQPTTIWDLLKHYSFLMSTVC